MKRTLCIIIGALLLTACGEERVSVSDAQTAEQSTAVTESYASDAVTSESTEQAEPTAEASEPLPEKSAAQMLH